MIRTVRKRTGEIISFNPEKITKAIEKNTEQKDLKLAGKIAYDISVTKAQIAEKSIVEYSNNGLKSQIISLWESVSNMLNTKQVK